MNKNDEVISIINQSLEKIKRDRNSYFDLEDYNNYLYQYLSNALIAKGNTEDGLQALSDGRLIPEYGGPNVSQSLNYAKLELHNKLYKAAVRDVNKIPLETTTESSRGTIKYIDACGSYMLGDSSKIAAAADQIAKEWQRAATSLLDLYICTNSKDDAKKALINLVNAPSTKAKNLVTLSKALSGEEYNTPYELEHLPFLKEIINSPEVKKAIAKNGYLLDIPTDYN